MSTSISPSSDLSFRPELAEMAAPFTSFQAGHFIKPAASAQPVAEQLRTFEGAFYDMYVVEALDLDYEEPNAVVEDEVEIEYVLAPEPIRQVALMVCTGVEFAPIVGIEQRDAA